MIITGTYCVTGYLRTGYKTHKLTELAEKEYNKLKEQSEETANEYLEKLLKKEDYTDVSYVVNDEDIEDLNITLF